MNFSIGEWINKIITGIERKYKVCFISAIICGLLAHIYALTNHLYNYDELWHTPAGFGTGVQQGRWALSVCAFIIKKLFGNVYTIPVINGTISIVMYALVACVVIEMFNINDEFYAGVTGALLVVFPSVVCRMFFMYTTHFYAIGVFIVALGVKLYANYENSKQWIGASVGAILLVVFGMAIYQANFVTAVCVMVGCLLQYFIRRDDKIKDSILKCVKYVVFLAVCMMGYFISNKLALLISGLEIEKHSENYDTMGQLSVSQLIDGIVGCYKTFLRTAIKDVYAVNPNRIVCVTFGICVLVLFYTVIRVWRMKKQLHNKFLVTAIVAVLPIAVNLIIIMAISSGVMYSIMVYEIVYMLIIPVACLEAVREYGGDANVSDCAVVTGFMEKSFSIVNIATAVAVSITVLTYIWFANGNYLAMEYTNMHDNAYYQTMMTQIKSLDGYRDDMKLVVIGKPTDDLTNSSTDLIGETFHIGGKAATNVAEYSSWAIMSRVIGFNPEVDWSDEAETYYKGLDEYNEMPNYPDAGSIRIVDDIVVVKLSGED